MKSDSILGCLLGTAVGDSIGLPYEGMSTQRGAKVLGVPDRHRFLFGRGMLSDDTEHTCMVASSLYESAFQPERFSGILAKKFRYWLLAIPAGVGFATLRSILKLWFWYPPSKSGVYSAGNGPAMRSAILGAAIDDIDLLKDFVKASTIITHSDPKAYQGALAIALAARAAKLWATKNTQVPPETFLDELNTHLQSESEELKTLIQRCVDSVHHNETTKRFAESIGQHGKVSGYVCHSVPVAIHAWLKNQNEFQTAIVSSVECGGDTDTVAAMVGGICGAGVGEEGIPSQWVEQITDWPYSIGYIRKIASKLTDSYENRESSLPIPPSFASHLGRNILFLFVVLFHGFRRLLPPY